MGGYTYPENAVWNYPVDKNNVNLPVFFLKNPSILILDEAWVRSIRQTENSFQQSFDELAKAQAHRLATIKNADRIIIVVTEDGLTKTARMSLCAKNGAYAALYKSAI